MNYLDATLSILFIAYQVGLMLLLICIGCIIYAKIWNYFFDHFIVPSADLTEFRAKEIYMLAGSPFRFSPRDLEIATKVYINLYDELKGNKK